MKNGLYSKIAFSSLVKNRRIYIPRILAETGLSGMFYIMMTLAFDDRLSKVKGGTYIPTFMMMGTAVLGILSVIIMFFINSFLMKQRKRDYGVYNVLGMEKTHIGKVLFSETVISSVISVALGLGFGILFYKLSSLLICKILQTEVVAGFYYISAKTVFPAPLFFLMLDFITYLFNRIVISRMKPVDLLSSVKAGEKEPKVKWVTLIIGLITLSLGYGIALITKNPLDAMYLFFVAVILVIIGTYCLFITGSTFVLKLLKKNEKYYYRKNHFSSVSGLLYRMKQNAVGLASIAILATGVLVMISTTVSLYAGKQETVAKNFPNDLYFTASLNEESLSADTLKDIFLKAATQEKINLKSVEAQRYLEVTYKKNGNKYVCENMEGYQGSISDFANFIFITEETYYDIYGEKLDLKENEIAYCVLTTGSKGLSTSVFIDENELFPAKALTTFCLGKGTLASVGDTYGIVLENEAMLQKIYESQKKVYGEYASKITNQLAVNFESADTAREQIDKLYDNVSRQIADMAVNQRSCAFSFDDIWSTNEALLGMYGTLFFLGILLGIVCMFATILIIYYKQISEGYDDRSRFQIMVKVGMSSKEVKKTINSQLLFQFFLPLIVCAVHMTVAFPIILKLLHTLLLPSDTLFFLCTLGVYALFTLVYTVIYRLTARTYYKIVY